MATFQLHEDVENAVQHQGKELSGKSSNLLNQQQSLRVPLARITNGVRGTKRVRIGLAEYDNTRLLPTGKTDSLTLECLQLVGKENTEYLEDDFEEDRCIPHDIISATEYAPDIWKYLYEMETKLQWPRANYMSKQKFLNEDMRSILVDWLVTVADEYKMNEQTIHLSVNYIDRFLSYMSVVREKFQLLGAAAMMLAVKVEEVKLLEADEWVYLTGQAYTTKQITRMEQLLLKVLKFDVNPPTIVTFIQQLCVTHGLDKKTLYTAMYISELILLEGGSYLQYMPSKLAVAAVVLARHILCKKTPWLKKLETSSGYTYKQLSPVITKQYQTYRDSPVKEQQAIQTKYKSDKYHKVAMITPKVLQFEECDFN